MSDTLRPAVRDFAAAMEDQLRANDYKPGWQKDDPLDLLLRLREEVVELDNAIDAGADPSEVLEESADIANFAMMIADVYRLRTGATTKSE
jgi:NTP pyrophosphatase (non-canonical NTP hydrolase)